MGPWLRSHGRDAPSSRAAPARLLQWGRGFAATEGIRGCGVRAFRSRLQWGRGFAATEGSFAAFLHQNCGRFNGAVASQPRKVP